MNIEPLSSPEHRLQTLEVVVTDGIDKFEQVAHALLEIRNEGLWKHSRLVANTFNEYCNKRFGFGRHTAWRLVAQAEIRELMPGERIGSTNAPMLRRDPNPHEAIEEARAKYGDDPTPGQLNETLRERRERHVKEGVRKPPANLIPDSVRRIRMAKSMLGKVQRSLDDMRETDLRNAALEKSAELMGMLMKLEDLEEIPF